MRNLNGILGIYTLLIYSRQLGRLIFVCIKVSPYCTKGVVSKETALLGGERGGETLENLSTKLILRQRESLKPAMDLFQRPVF